MNEDQILYSLDPNTFQCVVCHKYVNGEKYKTIVNRLIQPLRIARLRNSCLLCLFAPVDMIHLMNQSGVTLEELETTFCGNYQITCWKENFLFTISPRAPNGS